MKSVAQGRGRGLRVFCFLQWLTPQLIQFFFTPKPLCIFGLFLENKKISHFVKYLCPWVLR